jgi:hypothetical protein
MCWCAQPKHLPGLALIYVGNHCGRNTIFAALNERCQTNCTGWQWQDLPFPIPGEGHDPTAQSLPDGRRRLSHRLEGPNRLRGLAP